MIDREESGQLEVHGIDTGKVVFKIDSSRTHISFEMTPDEADAFADRVKTRAQWCRELKPPKHRPRSTPVKPEDRQWGHHYCRFCEVELYTNDGKKTWWHAMTGFFSCDPSLTSDGAEHTAEPVRS